MGPELALSALSVVSTLAGGLFQQDANEQRKKELELQENEQEIAASAQTMQRQNQLQSILSSQQASFGSRGLQPSSASFRAIGSQTFNDFAKDQQLSNLDTKLRIDDLKQQRKNLQSSSDIDFAKTALSLGSTALNAYRGFNADEFDEQGQNGGLSFLPKGLNFL